MRHLTEREKAAIRNYRYKGGDDSLIYKHALSPFAQWLVENLTPTWVAPNVITLLGLVCTTFAMVLTLVYNPYLNVGAPRWLCLLSGICVFAYQTLDNMDGKQARRTGSSSALGMFFDHTCDAFNSVIMGIPMCSVLATRWSIWMYFYLFQVFSVFFFQIWEEYYIGSMVLPVINGATEGVLIAVAMSIFASLYGNESYHDEFDNWSVNLFKGSFYEIKLTTPFQVGVGFTTILAVGAVINSIVRVVVHQKRHKRSVLGPILNLLPFFAYLAAAFIYTQLSSKAFAEFRTHLFLLLGCIFIDLVVLAMRSHICESALTIYKHYGAWSVLLLPLNIMVSNDGPLIDEYGLIVALCLYSFATSMLTVLWTIYDFGVVLNINTFTLGPRKAAFAEKKI
jgi:ethanolaminephosphotransferase